MGLLKTFNTQYGIPATYWRIEHFEELDYKRRRCTVIVQGFKDEASKVYAPLKTMRFTWNDRGNDFYVDAAGLANPADFPFTFEGNLYPETYSKLKTLPEWEGAVDV